MSKNKGVRAVVGIICVLLIAIGIAFSIAYHVWTARGDQVQFSATGSFGLGSTPLSSKNGRGQDIQYGANHNYLFVRDVAVDVKAAKAMMAR